MGVSYAYLCNLGLLLRLTLGGSVDCCLVVGVVLGVIAGKVGARCGKVNFVVDFFFFFGCPLSNFKRCAIIVSNCCVRSDDEGVFQLWVFLLGVSPLEVSIALGEKLVSSAKEICFVTLTRAPLNLGNIEVIF